MKNWIGFFVEMLGPEGLVALCPFFFILVLVYFFASVQVSDAEVQALEKVCVFYLTQDGFTPRDAEVLCEDDWSRVCPYLDVKLSVNLPECNPKVD